MRAYVRSVLVCVYANTCVAYVYVRAVRTCEFVHARVCVCVLLRVCASMCVCAHQYMIIYNEVAHREKKDKTTVPQADSERANTMTRDAVAMVGLRHNVCCH